MSHANHVGFVHWDLAARNVLVDSALQSKMVDFGMTRQGEEEESAYNTFKGGVVSVRWSAPEALQDRKFSQFGDVWAFGMTIFEAWTNAEKPYNGWSNDQIWTRVLGSEDAEPCRLPKPEGCSETVYQCMHRYWHVFQNSNQHLTTSQNISLCWP